MVRNPMKRWLIVGALALTACGAPPIDAYQSPDTNQVSYWCSGVGIKIEPVSTPFVVPPPPAGYTYTLLVLKAGSGLGENETFANPVVGQAYVRTDGKSISHVILCKEPPSTTSTTSTSTTSTTVPTSFPPTNTFGVPGGSTTTTVPGSTTTFPPDTPPVVPPPITGPPAVVTTTTSRPAPTNPPPVLPKTE